MSVATRVEDITPTTTHIELQYKRLGDEGSKELAEILKTNQSIISLKLRHHEIGYEGATAIAEALKVNKSVTKIALYGNEIGNVGATAFAEALKCNQSITRLDISNNRIGYDGVAAIAEALKSNRSITQIKFTSNSVKDRGATAIAEALKLNKSITKINLCDTSIRDEGATVISEAMKINQTIVDIDLHLNQIGEKGAIAIAEAMNINQSIANIDLSHNDIGGTGVAAIAEALKTNQTITNIGLQFCDFGDVGAKAIFEALKINHTIINIKLSYNDIGDDTTTTVLEALKINYIISNIDVSHNKFGIYCTTAIMEALRIHQLSDARNITVDFYSKNELSVEFFATKFPNFHLGELWKQALYGRGNADIVRVPTVDSVAVYAQRLPLYPVSMRSSLGLEVGAYAPQPVMDISSFIGPNPKMFRREGLLILRGEDFETGISYNDNSITHFLFFGKCIPQQVALQKITGYCTTKGPITCRSDLSYYQPAVIYMEGDKTVVGTTTWANEKAVDLSAITTSGPLVLVFRMSLESKSNIDYLKGLFPWLLFAYGELDKDKMEQSMRPSKEESEKSNKDKD